MYKLVLIFACIFVASNFSIVNAMSNTEGQIDENKENNNGRPIVAETRQDILQSKSIITEIMSKDPFVDIQQEKIWNFEEEDKKEAELNPDLEWLGIVIRFMAMIVEAALWLIPVVIAFYLYNYREYWLNLIQGNGFKKEEVNIPETLFGLDIRQENMPDNIEQSAMEMWQQKKFREAVSLLYRGSLAALFQHYKFELPPGATEQDCIHHIELSESLLTNKDTIITPQTNVKSDSINPRIKHFKDLTQVWINIAYAHRLPDEVIFKQVCHNWNLHFSENEISG